jgi:hypothetical protein
LFPLLHRHDAAGDSTQPTGARRLLAKRATDLTKRSSYLVMVVPIIPSNRDESESFFLKSWSDLPAILVMITQIVLWEFMFCDIYVIIAMKSKKVII